MYFDMAFLDFSPFPSRSSPTHWVSLCSGLYTVSVLGRDEGYTVKYNPLPEGVPDGEGLYLSVYPELSPNTDIISF